MTDFEKILSRIRNGELVSAPALVPYLAVEHPEHRKSVNLLLAEAYFQAGGPENLQHAKVFVQRAWLLSRFSPDLLPLYVHIFSALDDIAGIKEAYKRVGVMMASQGNISQAIAYFDLWQYAYASFRNVDKYEYDVDVLDCIDRLAQPHRFSHIRPLEDGKIRVAYLVKGITETGSVLIKVNLNLGKYHDRSRIEPMFFVPETERAVLDSIAGREHLRLFESLGYKVSMAPNLEATDERLLAVGQMINDARPHLLVTCAALADFQHAFISALHPAPTTIGLIQGPPPQFGPLWLDWGLAWSKHPLIESPFGCSMVGLAGDLPKRDDIVPYDRRELGIPDEAILVASAGRYVKFQEPAFWQAVIDLLNSHPKIHYLVMGAEEAQIPFLKSMLSRELRSRITFLSWQGGEYLRALCLTDVLIDTFPSGGGGILLDALAIGIPCVSFENNYMRMYDQNDWSLGDEFICVPEVIVPRGDFAKMNQIVLRLVEDPEYRREIAQRSYEYTQQTRSVPGPGVRQCEDVYARVLENRLSGNTFLDSREAEIEEITCLAQAQDRPGRLFWIAYQMKRVLHLGERMLDRIAERKG